jgi:ATP-binding protein involved in chromosome partitioning
VQRIAVVSGKGGVGKSTVTVGLAAALRDAGAAVGILDADLYGPDVPRMFGLTRTEPAAHVDLTGKRKLRPVEVAGVKVMSVQFLVSENQPLAWASSLTDALLVRLLQQTAWGDVDVLLIDLPPGTADVQQRIVTWADLTGAIVVVTPHDVAHLDAKKVVEMLRRSQVPILGGVENMSGLSCPHCGEHVTVFPDVDPARSIWVSGVERVLTLPLDPAMALAADVGRPHGQAFAGLATAVLAAK